ncbi:rCG50745 [Rattus norvegicus]|uniref:G protein-coupled receptor 84 n=2 Tax=Rattus norvegicus TaxID=10116 RepID=D4ACK0_RAT|nr:G-protein coupled receptor 84 [Rattus norvegicus]XP_006242510.1 G-protein coupled receptor 84 isoform X1 [Rattus norvegicus]XP_006242511.1 G-protein coupled receptor 84 isoform X1 [Rattus norvegicus]EDL86786.1 rCG50745 [Rattus norvegicus]|eukprot:NP_001102979.1 G-protein coupled receptor 84 [Rattus norvegicus]
MWNSSDDNFSCYHESVLGYRYFAVIWGMVVAATGTVGNVLTLLALAIRPKLRTRFNLLIANLTLADLLYCTLLQPFSVDTYLHLHWRTGAIFCRIFGLLLFTSNSVSILTLCLIALGRYLLIAHPKLFPQVFSAKGIVLALVGSWVVGVTSFAPLWNVYVLVPVVCTCSFDRVRGRPYTTILMGIFFVVGLSSVGVFYCLIHRQVKRAARALDKYGLQEASMRSHQVSGTHEAVPGHFQELDSGLASRGPSEGISSEPVSAATTQTLEGDSSEAGDQGMRKAAQQISERSLPEVHRKTGGAAGARRATDAPSEFGKVTRMCFAVFLCFVLSYIPFLLLNILDARGRAPRVVHMVAANLTWLNSCINPVLYAAMNRQFRQAYGSILKRGPQSFRRFH